MGDPSPFAQLKTARISQSALVALATGIVVGLVLGLLIGWVWWPVEWQGDQATVAPAAAPGSAQPAGTLESTAARASYLAAVADAYVPYSNADAAALASQRAAALGGDLRANFEEAIAYLATQPNANVQINNLVTLASAIGIPLEVAGNPALTGSGATPAAVQVEAVSTQATAATPPPAPAGEGGPNLLSWLAILLLALGLVVGGGFLLRRVAQRRTGLAATEENGGFVMEEMPMAPPARASFDRSALDPPPAASNVRTAPGVQSSTLSQGSPGFEADDDDFDQPAIAPVRTQTYRPVTPVAAIPAETGDVDDLEEEDEEDDYPVANPAPANYPPPATVDPAAYTSGARLATAVPPRPPVAGRNERYTPLDRHVAAYQAGMHDFDHTRNVENPQGTGYIGEYGIGISERNGTLNNNLDQVVALEVYLFDKSDESQMMTVTRFLLSEYAHDNLYRFFDREKTNTDPITAQPNTNFQLESRQLLLDCTVTDVRYLRDGVFQAITVEMVLKQKV